MSAALNDPALGLLETKTLTRGIEACDAMVKEAPVQVLWARVNEPGRYLVLVGGLVDDVRQALRRGRTVAGEDVHDELFLAGPHRALLRALEIPGQRPPHPEFEDLPGGRREADDALGLIECGSVAATLLAADAAAKVAHVRLLAVRTGPDLHGKGLVAFRGEPADVESAVARGAGLAEERAMLVRSTAIPGASPRALEAALLRP
ncbi:MAG TPA: BMC domain-containing protein [Planctomycetota bacterium]|nr:BMC domain-containing protein [Planctomycetota bacterium]